MKTKATIGVFMVAAAIASLTGCTAEEISTDQEDLETSEQALINNGAGGTTTTKDKLIADGYQCAPLGTATLCWKNGSPGYTCNDRGTCPQNLKSGGSRPIYTNPGVVFAR